MHRVKTQVTARRLFDTRGICTRHKLSRVKVEVTANDNYTRTPLELTQVSTSSKNDVAISDTISHVVCRHGLFSDPTSPGNCDKTTCHLQCVTGQSVK